MAELPCCAATLIEAFRGIRKFWRPTQIACQIFINMTCSIWMGLAHPWLLFTEVLNVYRWWLVISHIHSPSISYHIPYFCIIFYVILLILHLDINTNKTHVPLIISIVYTATVTSPWHFFPIPCSICGCPLSSGWPGVCLGPGYWAIVTGRFSLAPGPSFFSLPKYR